MITLNIMGAGAVGQTFGYLLVQQNLVVIAGVMTRSVGSALPAIEFMGQGTYCASVLDLPRADLTLITTPDKDLPSMAKQLLDNPHLQPGDVVMHCSGALSSDCLSDLQAKGLAVASLHPMMSFKQPKTAVTLFQDIPCAVEGDELALDLIVPLFTRIGSSIYAVHKDKKALYHVAAVFASNYQLTLAEQAKNCLLAAGVSDQQAQKVVISMMRSVLSNMMQTATPKAALTGPLQRGDATIIATHLQAMTDPVLRELYCTLGLATLPLTTLGDEQRERMIDLLEGD